jgi:hypothetical protein
LGVQAAQAFGTEMSKQTSSPAWRCLPSLTDVAFVLPFVLLFARLGGVSFLLQDCDTGWHIRTGEWILRNGRIPDRDIFSFTKAGEPWFAWEWLWDVIFGWMHQHWGLVAVVMASILAISVTTAMLYRLTRRKCPNVLIAFGVTFLAVGAFSIHWLARPHLFTILFAVIFYSLLERVRDGDVRLLWLLPGLMVVWTNLHGGFFVGIALIGAYAAGELAGWALESQPEARRAALGRSKPYLWAAGGCLAASLINPYFYHEHIHIVRYLSEPYQLRQIQEFQPMSFQHPAALFLESMLLLGVLAAAWNLYRKRFGYVILLAGAGHLALMSARNIPLFAVLAAPLAAEALGEAFSSVARWEVAGWLKRTVAAFESYSAEVAEQDAMGRIPVASVAAALLLLWMVQLPGRPAALRVEFDAKAFPVKAVAALRGQQPGPIFTGDQWGDYLIYRLYPSTKVFVDGRSDFYGAKFGEKFLEVMDGKYDWKGTLDRYGIETVLLPVNASLASTLKESREWRPVYDDGVAILFRSTDAGAAARMARLESVQSSAVESGGIPVIARSPTIIKPRDRKVASSDEGTLP